MVVALVSKLLNDQNSWGKSLGQSYSHISLNLKLVELVKSIVTTGATFKLLYQPALPGRLDGDRTPLK
jgi:hypothetical protein